VTRRLAFPLVSRQRVVGRPFGTRRSRRRGRGGQPAGSRPYVPGDPIATIDWAASARLSAARGADEFIVREQFDEEAPLVAIVLDQRPSMGIPGTPPRQLDKPAAAASAARVILASADDARASVALLDRAPATSLLLAPTRGRSRTAVSRVERAAFTAPRTALDDALARLRHRRPALPPGSFVFVVSDFLVPFRAASWGRLARLGADVVPVIVQDAAWERSFPPLPGVVLPVVDVETGRSLPVRLTRRDVRARRDAHEQRFADLVGASRAAGMDPVVIDDASVESVHRAFLDWARRRLRSQRRTR
jgi:uncharacterized protein (DUF58 family)